ncbi:MAG TPA: hypothetical protein VN442_05870 [Bryobacteraceae bacterium]|nr:hypothetical protein [Bryobacteraceae bacterium]
MSVGVRTRASGSLQTCGGAPFTLERRYGVGYRKVVFPAGDAAALGLP